jgi:microcystin-dependent protein
MLGLDVRFITRVVASCLMLVLGASLVDAGTIARPTKTFGGTSFINGVIPQASDFNGDLDTIYSEFNGGISNANINASAAIAASKLEADGFTTNVRSVHAAPCHILDESDQSADAKRWYLCLVSGELRLTTNADVGTVQNTWLTMTRANGGFTLGGTSGTNVINGATTFNQNVTFNGSTSFAPSGTVQMYMGTSAPSGWLLMDGASVSCTGASSANAALCAQLVSLHGTVNYKGSALGTFTVDTGSDEIIHAAHGKTTGDRVHFTSTTTLPTPLNATTVYCIISTTAGRFKISTTCGGASVDITDAGSGTHSDYFNFVTPDARGRNVLGTGSGAGLTNRVIGATGGGETHALSAAELASHTHTATMDLAVSNGTAGSNTYATRTTNTNSTTLAGVVTGTTGATGSGTAHTIVDPFIVMTYIIKL